MSRPLSTSAALAQLTRASEPTFKMHVSAATTFVGVGTTGSMITLAVLRLLAQKTSGYLPANTRWVSIDADKDSRNSNSIDERIVRFVPLGQDGAGTVISNGRHQATEAFPAILRAIKEAVATLAHKTDHRFPVNQPASDSQTLVAIAGSSGGSSGGSQDLVVTAGHVAAHDMGLSRFNLDLITVGSEIPWRDIDRELDQERILRIAANSAENAMWVYNQMATRGPITIEIPGKDDVRMHAATRVTSKLEFDWASETTKLPTNEDLIAVMATTLFHRYFTATGSRRASRHCDDFNTGLTAQKHPAQQGVDA